MSTLILLGNTVGENGNCKPLRENISQTVIPPRLLFTISMKLHIVDLL